MVAPPSTASPSSQNTSNRRNQISVHDSDRKHSAFPLPLLLFSHYHYVSRIIAKRGSTSKRRPSSREELLRQVVFQPFLSLLGKKTTCQTGIPILPLHTALPITANTTNSLTDFHNLCSIASLYYTRVVRFLLCHQDVFPYHVTSESPESRFFNGGNVTKQLGGRLPGLLGLPAGTWQHLAMAASPRNI